MKCSNKNIISSISFRNSNNVDKSYSTEFLAPSSPGELCSHPISLPLPLTFRYSFISNIYPVFVQMTSTFAAIAFYDETFCPSRENSTNCCLFIVNSVSALLLIHQSVELPFSFHLLKNYNTPY